MRHLGTKHLLRFALAGLAIGSGAVTSAAPGQVVTTTATDDETPAKATPPADPAARIVLERAIEAMGGLDGRRDIRSSRSQARLEMGETAATIDLTTMTGNRLRVRYRTDYRGRPDLMEIGCDGSIGWRIDPPDGLVTEITPELAQEFARRFDFQSLIREIDLRFEEPRLLPPEDFEERSCRVIGMRDGEQEVRILFEDETGLPVALELIEPNVRRSRRKVVIESWSEPAEGSRLRWIRRFRLEQAGVTWTAEYAFVNFNDVSESTFLPPSGLTIDPGGDEE